MGCRLLMSASQAVDRPTEYYGYRLTLPHVSWSAIKPMLEHYSADWCACMHFPDELESECMKEHYHMVFRDFDRKKIDSFKKAISTKFNGKGNGLHAGSLRDNHISHAIGYMKHDEHVTFYHSGQSHWDEMIEAAPVFVKSAKGPGKVYKEKLSDPVLTHANLVKQAVKFGQQYMADETSLQNVLSRMVNQANWIPSRDILRNGVPREFHELFMDRVTKRSRTYLWMAPHVPSEDKAKWLDRPDTTPILVADPVPGGAARVTKDQSVGCAFARISDPL